MKDEALMEIAATAPADVESLARIRSVTRGFAEGRIGEALLEAIAATDRPARQRAAPRPAAARYPPSLARADRIAQGVAGRQV